VSRPERDLAILNAGRRDLSFDAGLPVAVKRRRRGSGDVERLESWWEVTRIMDQHAMLRVPPAEDLAVGDLVALGVSHPCTTFDKFRVIPVLDDESHVVDAIVTMF
jgi:D-serine dehydratase